MNDCPPTWLDKTWTVELPLFIKVCQTEAKSWKESRAINPVGTCALDCSESMEPGMPPEITGGCTIKCSGFSCAYFYTATCTK